MKLRSLGFGLLTVLSMASGAYAATCEGLKTLALENTTITSAQPVAAGEFSLPGALPGSRAAKCGLQTTARIL